MEDKKCRKIRSILDFGLASSGDAIEINRQKCVYAGIEPSEIDEAFRLESWAKENPDKNHVVIYSENGIIRRREVISIVYLRAGKVGCGSRPAAILSSPLDILPGDEKSESYRLLIENGKTI